jgi:hypothetical protein
MASPGEKTGAGHGVGGVKVTSIMAKMNLERRVLKLHTISCKMRKNERMT